MADSESNAGPVSPAPNPPGSRQWRLWVLLGALVLLAGGGAFAAWWYSDSQTKPKDKDQDKDARLEGELIVLVRPSAKDKELIQVDEAGAVPVRFGGVMSLEVRLKPAAY